MLLCSHWLGSSLDPVLMKGVGQASILAKIEV